MNVNRLRADLIYFAGVGLMCLSCFTIPKHSLPFQVYGLFFSGALMSGGGVLSYASRYNHETESGVVERTPAAPAAPENTNVG